jgi:hypothetical protein
MLESSFQSMEWFALSKTCTDKQLFANAIAEMNEVLFTGFN